MNENEDKQKMLEAIRKMEALFDYIDRRDDFHGTRINQEKQERYNRLCILARVFEARHCGSHSDDPHVSFFPPTQTAPFGMVSIERYSADEVDLGFCTPEDMKLLKGMLELSDEMITDSELIDEKSKMQCVSLMFAVDGIVEK